VDEATAGVRAKKTGRDLTVRRWALSMLVALLVQFGLGMYVNLFVPIPLNHPGHSPGNYLTGTFSSVTWTETSQHAPLVLATHAGAGLVLGVGSLWLAIRGARGRRRAVTRAAVLGALCILGAGFNGGSFLDYNANLSSYLMALLFAAAVLCYGVILTLTSDTEQRTLAP
jgi:heme A synthase